MRKLTPSMAYFLFILAAAQPADVRGQEDEEVQRLQTRIEGFFENLDDDEVEPQKAFADLLAGGPLATGDFKKLLDGVADLEKKYGGYIEAEQIVSKRVGRDLVLLKYLYKTPTFPIVWYFTYYRPPSDASEWVVITVRFDTRLDLLGI